MLLGRADGVLQPGATYPLASYGKGALTADLNGDGRLDLVMSSIAGVEVLVGKGDGTFGAPVMVAADVYIHDMADFDSDGKLDLIYSHRTGVGVRMNQSK